MKLWLPTVSGSGSNCKLVMFFAVSTQENLLSTLSEIAEYRYILACKYEIAIVDVFKRVFQLYLKIKQTLHALECVFNII